MDSRRDGKSAKEHSTSKTPQNNILEINAYRFLSFEARVMSPLLPLLYTQQLILYGPGSPVNSTIE